MIFDAKSYIDYDLLKEIEKDVTAIIKTIDWYELEKVLLSREKNNFDVTWYLFRYFQEKNVEFYETNSKNVEGNDDHEDEEDITNNDFSNPIHWLFLTLFDNNHKKETILDSYIYDRFKNVIPKIKKLTGINVAGIHMIEEQSFTHLHRDYDPGVFCNVVATIQNNNTKLLLDGKYYNLTKNNIFVFDAGYEHRLENKVNEKSVFFVLRISQKFFNNEI